LGKRYWKRTPLRPFGWDRVHRWIDGRDCPVLADVVKELARTVSDKPTSSFIPPIDAPVAAVQGPGIRRDFRFGSYEYWWVAAQAKLAPCWRAGPPVVAGVAFAGVVTEAEAALVDAPH
jgi:hypothetical protein